MKSHLKYTLAILTLLVISLPAFAFDSKSIIKIDAPYGTLYHGTFDNLVLDFSVLTARPDTLKAVSLKNLGTADDMAQISYLTLWADSGLIGFQGLGIDRKLGNFKYFGPLQNWYADNLNERITDSQRFFVSAELYTYIDKSATLQLQIPVLVDSNENKSFDLTDYGIFMDSGDNGPVDLPLTNANTQVISTATTDTWPPKIAFSNLANEQLINNNKFLIQGLARDQGNSGVLDLKIFIDGLEEAVVNYDSGNYAWQYNWQNISDGGHSLKLSARDQAGNLGWSDEITIQAQNQFLSLANSSASLDRAIIRFDGLDKAMATVKLTDINNQPIANRQVSLAGENLLVFSPQITDSMGQAVFEVRSSVLGPKVLEIKSDDQIIASLNLEVNLSGADFTGGDLIKASGPAVYYFGNNGKRYVFVSADIYFSWYSDFKSVKKITDSQLARLPIGGNVTYKPGVKLIKISSDPKVYAVDKGGALRWIGSEEIARSLYGSNWTGKIIDVSVTSFGDYKQGTAIMKAGDYNLSAVKAIASINEDKGL